MGHQELAELNDEELLQEFKKVKPTKYYDATIIGALVGIALYSAIKNGIGWLTFLPLIYLPMAAKNRTKANTLKTLLKERGLE